MAKDNGRKDDSRRPLVWLLVDALVRDLGLTASDARDRVTDMPRLEVLFVAAKGKIDLVLEREGPDAVMDIAFDDQHGTPATVILEAAGILTPGARLRMREMIRAFAAAVLVEKTNFHLRKGSERGRDDRRPDIRLVKSEERRTA